jgi:hypothetical protein
MKRGFTVVSLVLYVTLFFAFTVFATAISTNLNHKVLSEKGKIIIHDNYMKLYSNLFNSAKASTSIDIIENNIVFSNGDIYAYDDEKNVVLKNSGSLVSNVEDFKVINLEEVTGIANDMNNIDVINCAAFNVSFKKYNETITRDIVITVGDDLYD